jgi:hypothetical protein
MASLDGLNAPAGFATHCPVITSVNPTGGFCAGVFPHSGAPVLDRALLSRKPKYELPNVAHAISAILDIEL